MTLQEIRSLVFQLLEQRFLLAGVRSVETLDGSFDLFESGVLDSLGYVELIAALEERLGVTLDTTVLQTNEMSRFGRFCEFLEEQAGRRTS